MYKQVFVNVKLKTGEVKKDRADWEKSIKEVKSPHWTVMSSKKQEKRFKNSKNLETKLRLLYLKTQFLPRCKHFSSRL